MMHADARMIFFIGLSLITSPDNPLAPTTFLPTRASPLHQLSLLPKVGVPVLNASGY
jgi:coproporphyrinogen III oxidase